MRLRRSSPAPLLFLVALLVLTGLVVGKGMLLMDELRKPPAAQSDAADDNLPSAIAAIPPEHLLAEPAAGPETVPAPEAGVAVTPGGRSAMAEQRAEALEEDFTSSELQALGELSERRRALEERERELDLRAALLDEVEAKLVARGKELEALRAKLEATIEQQDTAEESKLARLVEIYESMKPKAAAEIFDRLEMNVLVEVVSRMRAGVSSEIMGRMSPERAEQLTAELARRLRREALQPAKDERAPAG